MFKKLSKPTRNKLEGLLSNVGDMSLKRRARRIIEEIDPKENDKIVDLGCGNGYYLFLLSNLGIKLKLSGFDYDKKVIKEASQLLSKKEIKFTTGDLHKIHLKKDQFDKAVMSEVLEHVANDGKVLKQVHKILKADGIFVISVPSIKYPLFWDPINFVLQHLFNTHIKSGFFSGLWSGHLRLYSLEELRKKFETAGFKVEVAEELTWWCLPFNHYLVNIVARLLYGVKISPKVADSLSKFKSTKKPFLINFAFKFVNFIDKLNEILPQKNGVNVFIKARKM